MKTCNKCGSDKILHEEKEGRGSPPKGWVRKRGDNRLISWKGIWDCYTCENCGETKNELRET